MTEEPRTTGEPRDRPPEGRDEAAPAKPGLTLGQKLKIAVVATAGIVALLLVVQNQDPTQTSFLFWSVEMPRFALLAFVYLLGAATGFVMRGRRGG